MSKSQPADRRPAAPKPPHPPLHVVLSYLLGASSGLHVVDAGRFGKAEGGRHDR